MLPASPPNLCSSNVDITCVSCIAGPLALFPGRLLWPLAYARVHVPRCGICGTTPNMRHNSKRHIRKLRTTHFVRIEEQVYITVWTIVLSPRSPVSMSGVFFPSLIWLLSSTNYHLSKSTECTGRFRLWCGCHLSIQVRTRTERGRSCAV